MQMLRKFNKEFVFIIIAFLLPLLFYITIFFGNSFGFDCAPGVMGNYPPYGQKLTPSNLYCASILDPGAYTWQFPAMWASVARQFFQGNFAIWSQNIGIGIPLAANFQSNAFNPILLPFILLFKASNLNLFYLDIFFVFRYMIMSLGMYLFLRSLKLDRSIAYIGSLAFISAGYFINIPTMAHHNVDMLLPLIAWSINKFYFTKQTKWIGISALLLGLSMLGGMPESSIFILFFSFLYVTFLSLFYIRQKKILFLTLGWLTTLIGFLIGAILYLPGIEYVLNGVNNHSQGSQYYFDARNIILFFLPKIFGGAPFYWSGFADKIDFSPQSWNYIGSIIFFLYLLSFTYLKDVYKEINKNRITIIFFFFFILLAILLLQLYGIIHFFIFEYLPGFRETQFTKYSSALINFSIITSVSIFLPILFKKKSLRILIVYILFAAILLFINFHYQEIITSNYFINKYIGLASNIFFSLVFISIIIFTLYKFNNKKIILWIIFLLLLMEFFIYFPRFGDKTRKDSFRQPPGISFLQKQNYHDFRIIGLDNILFPDLSAIYDLNDMRMLDALWIGRYYDYIKNFYAVPDAYRITGIQEVNATQSANIINNNFFDMLSVKYLLSFNNIQDTIIENGYITEMLKQNPNVENFNKSIFTIKKDSKKVLFEHAPNNIKADLIKPQDAQYLILFPAMSQDLFGKKEGDGVGFIAKAYVNGSQIDAQEISINPSHNKSDEKWFTMKLGPFPNSDESYKFNLELITVQLQNNAFDWAGWGGFTWDTELNKAIDKYKLVYDKDMKIYENKDFIPRLRFISQTICVNSNKTKQNENAYIVDLMKQHAQEIKNLAIVESDNCRNRTYDPGKGNFYSQQFQDQKISFTYSSQEEQYAILSDSYYPGWNIYIKGKKGVIDPANLAFRGFKLPQGDNVKVEIKYEPISFQIGLFISLFSLGIIIIIIYKNKKIK